MERSCEFPLLRTKLEVAEERRSEVAAIRYWTSHIDYLPHISDSQIMLFLHVNYFNLEKTKKNIEDFFVVRAQTPALFSNRTIEEYLRASEILDMVVLGDRTEEGYQVMCYRLRVRDPWRFNGEEALRSFVTFVDSRVSECPLSDGLVIVVDMTDGALLHLAKVAASIRLLKAFMFYVQCCALVKLKGTHFINIVPFMDLVMNLVKPFLDSEIKKMLHFHSSVSSLYDHLPREILPSDYGGSGSPISQLQEEQMTMMKTHYVKWLKDSEYWIADLNKKKEMRRSASLQID